MEKSDKLKKIVIDGFSNKVAVEKYTKEARAGLWKSEEILIKKYFKKGSNILDIGFGTGRTTIPLFKMGYKVIGVDITPKFVEIAKDIAKKLNFNIDYRIGDATNLKFNDNTFDNALFSFNGWNQIPGQSNRLKTLKEVYRILKPGGYFIFTTSIRRLKGYTVFWIKQWIRYYILRPLGFRIEEIDFGDRFFKRGPSSGQKIARQYIHIPRMKNVKESLEKTGFKIIFIKKRSEIVLDEDELKNPKSNPMFFVCRK